jgi:16S rRNA (uracil1498-N3)-methyltransferase
MQLFYTPDIQNGIALLDEVEARHAAQVLRKKVGDVMQLTDGKGNLYEGDIIELGKKTCTIGIKKTIEAYNKRHFYLHLAIAPTKNIDRLEWCLEKATEIGVDEITPLICKRSERTVVKHERLNGILISAMKQSLKTYLPTLNEAIGFQDFMKKAGSEKGQKFIAYCNDDSTGLLSHEYEKGSDCVILIGPEGDFTAAEVGTAFAQGFKGVSLGKSRLRTETAGVVACHTVNLLNEF